MPDLLIGALLVSMGAAIGTPARFFVTGVVSRRVGETFPWGTLVVNVTGCAAMGVAAAFAHRHGVSDHSRLWLLGAVGFLGSYTTVSSFALQTLALVRDGERGATLRYIAGSCVLCLAAVAGGFVAGGGVR
ncbi:MAG: fluoride efflux transporter CrcB [Enhydrobacter sp.]|nr:MAG: fluoride efflux transporter CrcB [Enhydrobacter sp.]